MDDEKKQSLLAKVRGANVRARDVASGNPAGSHLNILADAVRALGEVVREVVDQA